MLKDHPDVKGIVFDDRGNPGGLLGDAYEAVDALLDSSEALVSIRDNNGIRAYGTDPSERPPKAQPGDITKGLPIGVLTNRGSASAAEIFSGLLKKLERSVTIGTRTWSKGTMQRISIAKDKSAVKLTEGEYLIGSPTNWIAVQCVGVSPDIEYEEARVVGKPKKELHECDLEGAIVSGGRSSDPNRVEVPLRERDPALYETGLSMREAVKALDSKEFAKMERIKKLLKIEDKPEDDSEEK
jgi:carboxyl-terminal processing protease